MRAGGEFIGVSGERESSCLRCGEHVFCDDGDSMHPPL
jgi:hypothetical protein